MALTYVGGNTGTWAGATSGNNNVSLTALTGGSDSAAQAGDIVVAAYATSSTANRALTISDGTTNYTLAGSELYANDIHDANLRVAYKVLSGADANAVFGPTGNTNEAGAGAVHVWRGIDSTTPLDVTVVTATGIDTGRPNAGTITPATAGAIVLVACAGAANIGAAFTQPGSELSNFRSVNSSGLHSAMIGIGSYAWSSGAFDPVAWTGGSATASDSWAAITLALRPYIVPTLVVADSSHGHTTDAVSVTTDSQLAVADASHAHAADNLTLTAEAGGTDLAVADALHAHTADSLTLSTDSQLAVADAAHAHSADALTLSTDSLLAVAEALHAHAADSITFTSDSLLAIANAASAHLADSPALTAESVLAVAEALHAHAADSLTLSTDSLLAIAEAVHAHLADDIALSHAETLAILEALHAHVAENVVLEVPVLTDFTEGYDIATARRFAVGRSRRFVMEQSRNLAVGRLRREMSIATSRNFLVRSTP